MEHNEEEKTKIEMLEKRLYSRDGKAWLAKRKKLPTEQYNVQDKWAAPETNEDAPVEPPFGADAPTHMSFFKKILLFSVIFFVIASAYTLFSLYRGSNSVSTDNIDIAVLGPVSVAGGEVLPLDITVQNKNNAPVELASLIVEYPDGTKSAQNISADMPRERDEIGDLAGGAKIHIQSKAILFGEEGSTKEIKVTFEYRVSGSNAYFDKTTSYLVAISSAPVSIIIDSLKEINSGQPVDLTLRVVSNSTSVIKNLLITAEYPFGWSFQSANPTPSSDKKVWNLGDLDPHGERTIKIQGKLDGQDGEQRIFKFNAGIASAGSNSVIGTSFLSSSQSISIQKPFLGLAFSLDGDPSNQYVAESGKTIKGQVDWSNNLPDQISNAGITVKLSGDLIDKSSVVAEKGFYRSSDNTITWDKSTNSELGSVNPGDQGNLVFRFSLLPLVKNGTSVKNPQFHVDVSGKGNRLSQSNVPEQINALVSRDVKVSTTANLLGSALYYTGAFKNAGPIPPKADSDTTYTIDWSVTNSSNSLSGAQVSATLPSYVTWLNIISPSSEKVTFNSATGEVVWNLGVVAADTGIAGSPREVSFQVGLSPSLSQVGTAPSIVGQATLTGTDNFTGDSVTAAKAPLDTNLVNDPNFQQGQDKVVK